MRNNWTKTFRRLAAACAIGGATAFSSAMCYAASIAYDTATDVAYDNGWQAGDNGGIGFGPWNFDGTYSNPLTVPPNGPGTQQTMDIFSHPNDLGRAWTLFNPAGPPDTPNGTDLGQAGRAIPGGLAVGDTLHLVVDNPTQLHYYRGWTVRFNSGGANAGYNGDNSSTPAFDPGSITGRLRVGAFAGFTPVTNWFAADAGPGATHGTPLTQLDTHNGMRIDFTLTGADTYQLIMTPLNDPSLAYTKAGTLAGAGLIDWIEFEHYGTDSDYYPVPKITGAETDFYISNMWITPIPEPATFTLLALATGLMVGAGGTRYRKD
jgi:hypothetical protein